jgi:hypothetical protein
MSNLGLLFIVDHLCGEGNRLHEEEIKNAYSTPVISLEELRNRRFDLRQ